MHPAPSIIVFTVFSGLGFGLLAFLGLGLPKTTNLTMIIYFFISFSLVSIGLISSTLHLGNPQRALKAFTQWKTSWLSREAWMSMVTMIVMAVYAFSLLFMDIKIISLGILGSVLSLISVFSTAMIYTQIKTVPRWCHWSTPILFILFSLAGGALLADQINLAKIFLVCLLIGQILIWRIGDTRFSNSGTSIETATGLGTIGKVKLFEAPHTGTNYLLKEMVYVIGRKHSIKLRMLGLILNAAIPLILVLSIPTSYILIAIAALIHIGGAMMLRWLFFAEAEHTVGLYYGEHSK